MSDSMNNLSLAIYDVRRQALIVQALSVQAAQERRGSDEADEAWGLVRLAVDQLADMAVKLDDQCESEGVAKAA